MVSILKEEYCVKCENYMKSIYQCFNQSWNPAVHLLLCCLWPLLGYAGKVEYIQQNYVYASSLLCIKYVWKENTNNFIYTFCVFQSLKCNHNSGWWQRQWSSPAWNFDWWPLYFFFAFPSLYTIPANYHSF